MKNCSHLYLLSAIACQLSECMNADELSVLAADITALGDMLSTVAVRQAVCESKEKDIVQIS